MLETYADIFTQIECALRRFEYQFLIRQVGFDEKKFTPDLAAQLNPFEATDLRYWLGRVIDSCKNLNLRDQHDLALNIFNGMGVDLKCEKLRTELRLLRESIQDALKRRVFYWVPEDRIQYYNNPQLFGGEVLKKFSKASPDMVEAGNCYAFERPTACVFHLMRVIPYGMDILARMLKVKFKTPIECLEWNSIIEPIDKAVRDLQKLSRSQKKFEDQKYYSEIVQHLYFCKDAWRNHVSHGRDPYDMAKAKSVMDHTGLVLELLAKRMR